jgi:CRISPR-associated protein Cas5h
MNILKFNISSNFGYFQDKINIRNNISYPTIHRPAILGMLGAILGMDGFSKLNQNKEIEYIDKLSEIEIGIVPHSNIEYSQVITNDNTSLDISNVSNRGTQKYENILNNPNYDIYLKINDNTLFKKIYKSLEDKNFVYEPTLGKSYFFANIKDVVICSILDKDKLDLFEEDLVFSKALYPADLIPDLTGEKFSDLFVNNGFEIGRKFILPVSSNSKDGTYNKYIQLSYNNFIEIDNVLNNNNFLNIDNTLIYFTN